MLNTVLKTISAFLLVAFAASADVESVYFSPDRAKIAYLNGYNLFVGYIFEAPSAHKQLSRAGIIEDPRPIWSPDSKRLAFQLRTGGDGGPLDVWIVDFTDENPTAFNLTNNSCDNKHKDSIDPAFSNDGRKLMYFTGSKREWELWSVDLTAKPLIPTKLTVIQGYHTMSAWSSDSKRLAYSTSSHILVTDVIAENPTAVNLTDTSDLIFARREEAERKHFLAKNPGPVELEPFDDAKYTNPVWSSDNKKLAYLKYTMANKELEGTQDLVMVDYPTNDLTPINLTNNPKGTIIDPKFGLGVNRNLPVWSNDSKRLAYTAVTGKRQDLWMVDLAVHGSSPINLTHNPEGTSIGNPILWSGDSKKLIYTTTNGDRQDIWMVDVTTKDPLPVNLTNNPEHGYSEDPAWSSDKRKLTYRTRVAVALPGGRYYPSDIWIVDFSSVNPTPIKLTSNDGNSEISKPTWADNTKILFTDTEKPGFVYWVDIDGKTPPRRILENVDDQFQKELDTRLKKATDAAKENKVDNFNEALDQLEALQPIPKTLRNVNRACSETKNPEQACTQFFELLCGAALRPAAQLLANYNTATLTSAFEQDIRVRKAVSEAKMFPPGFVEDLRQLALTHPRTQLF